MRSSWWFLFLLPALVTCSLHYQPTPFQIQLESAATRAPDLAQMSCFAVVMRRTGLDTVSDAVTGNFPHTCLGLNGEVSNLVSYAGMTSGVRMTLTAENHTGEILAFKSPDGDCAGKTLTELFQSIPQVYSVAAIPLVAVRDVTTIRVASTYQSSSAADKVAQCPRALACSPAGSISCQMDISVTADNFYAVYLADQTGGAARLIMSAPDSDWTSVETQNSVSFAANEYFYLAAWNVGFSRGAMFRLIAGGTTFESSASRLVGMAGPTHSSDATALTPVVLASILQSGRPWYDPHYSAPNAPGNGFSQVVAGLGQARWFWLDTLGATGEEINTDPSAVFYSGADTEPNYVIFRSKCRLVEIANQENGCR